MDISTFGFEKKEEKKFYENVNDLDLPFTWAFNINLFNYFIY